MSLLDFLLKLLTALGCGILIGLERQYRQRQAGLRTSALVATGSSLFVLMAELTKVADLTVAAQVVSGVGFLCAGVILRDGLSIRGLNTAGTLWCASGVGVLAGLGYYLPAFIGAAVVFLANIMLRPLARIIDRTSKDSVEVPVHYLVRVTCLSPREPHIRSLLLHSIDQNTVIIRSLQSEDCPDPARVEIRADLYSEGRKDAALEQIVARVSLEESVSAVRWEIATDEEKVPENMLNPSRDLGQDILDENE
ncbi:MgtC/SapB family protein [Ktedonosporobacter rubrisoli]|uniref:MgtC/SapB family protein n=1 Tax=Ktedonosporobacter rubrisoli TaxID=2509675 RepID=A0A4P6JMM2_KTERU|nr:MgtC/SapB family protein [Ktedonosporobacter rubrisoli]QBD76272.1 MgtC/SapB family protein [Ktedonosporobacter rubrisoli]